MHIAWKCSNERPHEAVTHSRFSAQRPCGQVKFNILRIVCEDLVLISPLPFIEAVLDEGADLLRPPPSSSTKLVLKNFSLPLAVVYLNELRAGAPPKPPWPN